MPDRTAYFHLKEKFRKISIFGEASAMLHWDMAVMMPEGGASRRSEQMALMSVMSHHMVTDPELSDLLDQAEASDYSQLGVWDQANLREMRRQWVHANAVPSDLVGALSKACSTCEMIWRHARNDGDFAAVMPSLQTVLDLSIEKAQAKAAKLQTGIYDALLDQYEPDERAVQIQSIFDDYAAFLPDFLQTVLARQKQNGHAKKPQGPFAIPAQEKLIHYFADCVGFDLTKGRLDKSAHPFSTGYSGDSRITVRYDKDDFTSSLMAVLHECGHARYEQGLPENFAYQPVGQSRGMTLHESQSLLLEMQACRSQEFIYFASTAIQAAFPEIAGLEADNLVKLYRHVEPSFIRVDADEVTYPAHIIVRFRLEKALIEGDLLLKDLPQAWEEAMMELLGICPPHNGMGCMQDIHWYDGAWGYFPTYSLGAMSAAQLFEAALGDDPSILTEIARGNFAPLFAWTGTHIHAKGSLLSTRQLMEEVTGSPLDPNCFKAHLKQRYL